MLTETFHSIVAAARNVLSNWKTMLLIGAVYALLLALLYLFVSIKEATLAQVTLTFAFAITVPLLFFILQAMIASGSEVRNEGENRSEHVTAGFVLRRSLSSFWKLILITLPLIALAVLIAYLLAKAQIRFGVTVNDAAATSSQRTSFCRLKNQRDRLRQPRPVRGLSLELRAALRRQAVEFRVPAGLGCLPVGGQKPAVLEAMQRRIQRALLDLQQVA